VQLLEDPKIAGTEKIDGVPATRVEGTFNVKRIEEIAGTPIAELAGVQPLGVRIWIDQEGRVRWLQSRGDVQFDSDGRPVRFLGVSVDVTHRRLMEQKLRASEERFSSFMQHFPGAAWIKDHDGCYVYANPTAHRIFRTTEQHLYGKADEEIFPAETARQFRDNDQIVMKSGQGLQTVEVLSQDGDLLYSLVSKFPIFDDNGALAFVGGIALRYSAMEESGEGAGSASGSSSRGTAASARISRTVRRETSRVRVFP
ncbi:MAG: hypothetical protein C4294_14105, partial [Nitrospiraceae bacterium]